MAIRHSHSLHDECVPAGVESLGRSSTLVHMRIPVHHVVISMLFACVVVGCIHCPQLEEDTFGDFVSSLSSLEMGPIHQR